MAKVKVIFGKLHGKIGGTVFRGGDDGMTIVSEYNGNPANPRTMAQTAQRNKMNLAGLVSKFTPKEVLFGLSPNARKARSMFVSTILKRATSTQGTTTNSLVAGVDAGSVVFSKGLFIPLQVTSSFDSSTRTLTVNISKQEDDITLIGVRVIVYVSADSVLKSCMMKDVNGDAVASPLVASIVIPSTLIGEEEGAAHIYVVPVYDNGSAAVTRFLSYVEDSSGSWQAKAYREIAGSEAVAASQYAGARDIVS